MMKKEFQTFHVVVLILAVLLAAGSAEARRYPSKPHNENFMSSCTTSLPTVYNPGINDSMQGGKLTRFSGKVEERVNSIEDAAKNGRPVTVAMDYLGNFGAKCNQRQRRCLLLVHVPGLDQKMPAYSKKFPNLPKNSFLAIVEDTGGAFFGKGTGKIDIPMRNGYHKGHPFKNVKFEVLDQVATNGRKKDYTYFSPFIMGRESKCGADGPRDRTREKGVPMASEPLEEVIQVTDPGDEDRIAPKRSVGAKKKSRRVASVENRSRPQRREPSFAETFFANPFNSSP